MTCDDRFSQTPGDRWRAPEGTGLILGLLRQPGGFKGVLLAAELRDPRDLFAEHRVEGGEAAIDRNAAALAAPGLGDDGPVSPRAKIGQSLNLKA